MKKAFSLVELIVVIALIGILASVLFVSMNGSSESAKTARCLANMRNLAAACQTFGAAEHRYPLAGSIEYSWVDESKGFSNVNSVYAEFPGWISWNSEGVYSGEKKPTSHQASSSWMISMYSTDEKASTYCLTNGTLWKYVSGNKQAYVCPLHAQKKRLKRQPNWSYLMNANFKWDYSRGSRAVGDIRRIYGDLQNAEKTLLFSEVPFSGIGTWDPDGDGAGTDCDCVLQYKSSIKGSHGLQGWSGAKGESEETIGVNHRSGKQLVANVVFADGHAEKLSIPFTGSLKKPEIDSSNLADLTAYLCIGQDVSFDGNTYKKVDK